MQDEVKLCKVYVEKRVRDNGSIDNMFLNNNPVDKNLYGESCAEWHALVVKNADYFHKIMQAFKITDLVRNGNLYFSIRLPEEYCMAETPLDNDDWNKWNVILVSQSRGEFEKAYGTNYAINKPEHAKNKQGI